MPEIRLTAVSLYLDFKQFGCVYFVLLHLAFVYVFKHCAPQKSFEKQTPVEKPRFFCCLFGHLKLKCLFKPDAKIFIQNIQRGNDYQVEKLSLISEIECLFI